MRFGNTQRTWLWKPTLHWRNSSEVRDESSCTPRASGWHDSFEHVVIHNVAVRHPQSVEHPHECLFGGWVALLLCVSIHAHSRDGDDAKHYQEKQVRRAVEEVQR